MKSPKSTRKRSDSSSSDQSSPDSPDINNRTPPLFPKEVDAPGSEDENNEEVDLYGDLSIDASGAQDLAADELVIDAKGVSPHDSGITDASVTSSKKEEEKFSDANLFDDVIIRKAESAKENAKLASEYEALKKKYEGLSKDYATVCDNTFLVWKTAKKMCKEKDEEIAKARRECDAITFRRGVRSIGKDLIDRMLSRVAGYSVEERQQFIQMVKKPAEETVTTCLNCGGKPSVSNVNHADIFTSIRGSKVNLQTSEEGKELYHLVPNANNISAGLMRLKQSACKSVQVNFDESLDHGGRNGDSFESRQILNRHDKTPEKLAPLNLESLTPRCKRALLRANNKIEIEKCNRRILPDSDASSKRNYDEVSNRGAVDETSTGRACNEASKRHSKSSDRDLYSSIKKKSNSPTRRTNTVKCQNINSRGRLDHRKELDRNHPHRNKSPRNNSREKAKFGNRRGYNDRSADKYTVSRKRRRDGSPERKSSKGLSRRRSRSNDDPDTKDHKRRHREDKIDCRKVKRNWNERNNRDVDDGRYHLKHHLHEAPKDKLVAESLQPDIPNSESSKYLRNKKSRVDPNSNFAKSSINNRDRTSSLIDEVDGEVTLRNNNLKELVLRVSPDNEGVGRMEDERVEESDEDVERIKKIRKEVQNNEEDVERNKKTKKEGQKNEEDIEGKEVQKNEDVKRIKKTRKEVQTNMDKLRERWSKSFPKDDSNALHSFDPIINTRKSSVKTTEIEETSQIEEEASQIFSPIIEESEEMHNDKIKMSSLELKSVLETIEKASSRRNTSNKSQPTISKNVEAVPAGENVHSEDELKEMSLKPDLTERASPIQKPKSDERVSRHASPVQKPESDERVSRHASPVQKPESDERVSRHASPIQKPKSDERVSRHASPVQKPESDERVSRHASPIQKPKSDERVSRHASPVQKPESDERVSRHASPVQKPESDERVSRHASPVHKPESDERVSRHASSVQKPKFDERVPRHASPVQKPESDERVSRHASPVQKPESDERVSRHASPVQKPKFDERVPRHASPVQKPESDERVSRHASPVQKPKSDERVSRHASPVQKPKFDERVSRHASPVQKPKSDERVSRHASPVQKPKFDERVPRHASSIQKPKSDERVSRHASPVQKPKSDERVPRHASPVQKPKFDETFSEHTSPVQKPISDEEVPDDRSADKSSLRKLKVSETSNGTERIGNRKDLPINTKTDGAGEGIKENQSVDLSNKNNSDELEEGELSDSDEESPQKPTDTANQIVEEPKIVKNDCKKIMSDGQVFMRKNRERLNLRINREQKDSPVEPNPENFKTERRRRSTRVELSTVYDDKKSSGNDTRSKSSSASPKKRGGGIKEPCEKYTKMSRNERGDCSRNRSRDIKENNSEPRGRSLRSRNDNGATERPMTRSNSKTPKKSSTQLKSEQDVVTRNQLGNRVHQTTPLSNKSSEINAERARLRQRSALKAPETPKFSVKKLDATNENGNNVSDPDVDLNDMFDNLASMSYNFPSNTTTTAQNFTLADDSTNTLFGPQYHEVAMRRDTVKNVLESIKDKYKNKTPTKVNPPRDVTTRTPRNFRNARKNEKLPEWKLIEITFDKTQSGYSKVTSFKNVLIKNDKIDVSKDPRLIKKIKPIAVDKNCSLDASVVSQTQEVSLVPIRDYSIHPKPSQCTASTQIINTAETSFQGSPLSKTSVNINEIMTPDQMSTEEVEEEENTEAVQEPDDHESDSLDSHDSSDTTDSSDTSDDSFIASEDELLEEFNEANQKNISEGLKGGSRVPTAVFKRLGLTLSSDESNFSRSCSKPTDRKTDTSSSPAKNTRSKSSSPLKDFRGAVLRSISERENQKSSDLTETDRTKTNDECSTAKLPDQQKSNFPDTESSNKSSEINQTKKLVTRKEERFKQIFGSDNSSEGSNSVPTTSSTVLSVIGEVSSDSTTENKKPITPQLPKPTSNETNCPEAEENNRVLHETAVAESKPLSNLPIIETTSSSLNPSTSFNGNAHAHSSINSVQSAGRSPVVRVKVKRNRSLSNERRSLSGTAASSMSIVYTSHSEESQKKNVSLEEPKSRGKTSDVPPRSLPSTSNLRNKISAVKTPTLDIVKRKMFSTPDGQPCRKVRLIDVEDAVNNESVQRESAPSTPAAPSTPIAATPANRMPSRVPHKTVKIVRVRRERRLSGSKR